MGPILFIDNGPNSIGRWARFYEADSGGPLDTLHEQQVVLHEILPPVDVPETNQPTNRLGFRV
jgi:hypothetical protein